MREERKTAGPEAPASLNGETLAALAAACADDEDDAELLAAAFASFAAYHAAIYRMETWLRLHPPGSMEPARYREETESLDAARTRQHNDVLFQLKLLNALAKEKGLPPVYAGPVSEERPVRRQCADAVLLWVREVIERRR